MSAGIAAVGDLFGSAVSYINNEHTNFNNKVIAAENRKWMSQENERNRVFEEQQAKINRTWQEMMYDKDWYNQTSWNDIGAQLKRAEAAGLNPYSILGSGAGVQGSNASIPGSPSAGVSPASTGAPGMIPMQSWQPHFGEIFKSFAEGIQALSNANATDKTLDAQIRSLIAGAKNQEQQAFFTSLQSALTQKWGDKQQDVAYREGLQRIMESQSKEDLNEAEKLLAYANAELVKAKSETEIQMRSSLVQYAKENVTLIKAQIKTENGKPAVQRSEINKNNASADESRAQAYSARELGKFNQAQREKVVSEAIALYEDQFGVHIDEETAERVRAATLKEMDNVIRQQGADYWNPFRYVGHVLGAGGNVSLNKAIK